jgi:hypothetical protein
VADTDPFISTTDLTDWIGRDVTQDNGAVMAVDAACEMVRRFADQTFNANTSTATLDGTGTDCLLLPELPVSAAGTVIENGGTLILDTDYVLANDGKLIRTGSGSYSIVASAVAWTAGRQNIQVTYDHGWAAADVPRDVRYVALALAQRMIIQGPAMTESVGGQSIGFAGPAADLTTGEKMIIEKYRPRA